MIGRVLLRVAREEVLVRLGLLPESALNGYAADDWHANAAPVGAAENGSDGPPEEAESADSLLDPIDPIPATMAQVDAEALAVLDKRVRTVGPVLRAVLHEPEAYSDYADCLPGNAAQLVRALEIVTTDTMPDVAAYFVAHHPSTRPDRTMELHFVSDYAALLIARQVSSPAHMELLQAPPGFERSASHGQDPLLAARQALQPARPRDPRVAHRPGLRGASYRPHQAESQRQPPSVPAMRVHRSHVGVSVRPQRGRDGRRCHLHNGRPRRVSDEGLV
jgi:hypothetical protein